MRRQLNNYGENVMNVITTNNPMYLKQVILEAFKSEGRPIPELFEAVMDDGTFAIGFENEFQRVGRRIGFRLKNQTHSKFMNAVESSEYNSNMEGYGYGKGWEKAAALSKGRVVLVKITS